MGLSDIYHTVDAKWVQLNMKKRLQPEGLWIFFFIPFWKIHKITSKITFFPTSI